jgi:hypothetical protein
LQKFADDGLANFGANEGQQMRWHDEKQGPELLYTVAASLWL